jgi:hypothetical protein
VRLPQDADELRPLRVAELRRRRLEVQPQERLGVRGRTLNHHHVAVAEVAVLDRDAVELVLLPVRYCARSSRIAASLSATRS